MATFGDRFFALREEREWTQEQAADEFNVSRSTVAGWENPVKARIPRPLMLRKIAERFGVNQEYLLGYTDIRKPYLENECAPDYEETIEALPDPEYYVKKLSKEFEEKNGYKLSDSTEAAMIALLRVEKERQQK